MPQDDALVGRVWAAQRAAAAAGTGPVPPLAEEPEPIDLVTGDRGPMSPAADALEECRSIADSLDALALGLGDAPSRWFLAESARQLRAIASALRAPSAPAAGALDVAAIRLETIERDPATRAVVLLAELTQEREQVRGSRTPWALRTVLVRALQQAWDEFCGDSGCYPDCIQVTGSRRDHTVSADFDVSNFASWAAAALLADLRPVVSNALAARDAEIAALRAELERAAEAWAWVEREGVSILPVLGPSGAFVGWSCGHVRINRRVIRRSPWEAVVAARTALDAARASAAAGGEVDRG